jgi:molybdopterin biosynthesis enzyme
MNGRPIVSLPAKAASAPVNVTLIAQKPLRRTLELSKSVAPGLGGSDEAE